MIPASNFPPNCGTPTSNFIYQYKKRKLSDRTFAVNLVDVPRVVSNGNSSISNVNDSILETFPSSSIYYDIRLNIDYLTPSFSENIDFIIKDPSVLNKNYSSYLMTYVNTGSSFIEVFSDEGETVRILASTKNPSITESSTVLKNWRIGSISRNIRDGIISLLYEKNSNQKRMFIEEVTNSPSNYTRNVNCWAKDIDLTCVSVWNSTAGNQMAGTAISPKHVVFCRHLGFYPNVGSSIKFVTNNNEIITRTITNMIGHPNFSGFANDISIGILNSDLPASIKPARILPSNYSSFFPTISGNNNITRINNLLGCITINQFKDVGLTSLASINSMFQLMHPNTDPLLNPSNSYDNFYRNLILYDSGSPAFIVINNEVILLGVFTNGGPGRGTFLSEHISVINNIMNNYGGGYQLSVIDLSSYSSY